MQQSVSEVGVRQDIVNIQVESEGKSQVYWKDLQQKQRHFFGPIFLSVDNCYIWDAGGRYHHQDIG